MFVKLHITVGTNSYYSAVFVCFRFTSVSTYDPRGGRATNDR